MPILACATLIVSGPVSGPALRRYVRLGRGVAGRPECLGWQTYRGIDQTEKILVVTEWEDETPEPLACLPPETLGEAASVGVLASSFEASFGAAPGNIRLARVAVAPAAQGELRQARDRDLALRSLAAPGSLRASLARDAASGMHLCVVDFDTEDALWGFMESPLRLTWSEQAAGAGEEEFWALNLPRLDFSRRTRPEPAELPSLRTEDRFGPLNIVLEQHEASGSAAIRAQGQLDPRGAARLERLCRTLAESGCRSLVLDISELRLAPETMPQLLRIVRDLKQAVDRLELTDNEQRFRRVTRLAHLRASVCPPSTS